MSLALTRLVAVTDGLLARAATRRHRLIGLAITRIIIGSTTVMYCLADYSRRELLWGPHGYLSPRIASAGLPTGEFSLFLVSNSEWWFELVFGLCIAVAIAFTLFGGRVLTLAEAVMLWSLHNRNQDILNGGDNLAQILIIFMLLTVTNAYFAPGAKRRRERLSAASESAPAIIIHNLGAYLAVFQTCVLYLAAGYWKVLGTVWQDGVSMYYISRVRQFDMFPAFAQAMNNPYLGTVITWVTIVIEIGFAFFVLSARQWLREVGIVMIEGMHAGIMIFMGLVTFGLIMIGADSVCLRDDDYLALHRHAMSVWGRLRPGPRSRSSAEPELEIAHA